MKLSILLCRQVLVMFLLLLTGYVLYKKKLVNDEGKRQITSIVLYVVTPCLIISTYQMDYDNETAKNILLGLVMSAAGILLSIIVANIVRVRAEKEALATERFAMTFSNCGFMGIPLINAVFSEIGVLYCTTYVTMFNIFCWTYGVKLMDSNKEKTKKSFIERVRPLCTITIFAIIIGLIMYFCKIKLPDTVNTTVDYIASMNTPLAMLVSGIYIAQSDIFAVFKKIRVYFLGFVKCIIIPMLYMLCIIPLPLDYTLKMSILICISCPTAANTMLFANRFGGDEKQASYVFTLTTLASVVTIPLVVFIAGFFIK